MFKKSFCMLLFASAMVLASFSSHLEAATLHSIIVADVEDKNNGRGITYIAHQMEDEIEEIAYYGGFKHNKKIFTREAWIRDDVVSYLKGLKIDKNDSVVFYWAGHGYHSKKQETPWPMMAFGKSQKALDMQDVIDILMKKKPYMGLILVDTCNGLSSSRKVDLKAADALAELEDQEEARKKGYKKLFRNFHGLIVTSSADVGEFSRGDGKHGGYYTRNFMEFLNEEVLKSSPSWQYILLQASDSVIRYNQHPLQEVWLY